MTTELDFRNVNALWASVLVETLARTGIRRAVVSPGSRSTPLTIAFARHGEIETVPILDERSAAFFALGLAKVDLRPVVLVCTSGTAAANYFPAIVEAHESGVPLLVITADRPPEMRASASGQTIDQQKLYGGYVNFYHELAVPELNGALFRYVRQTVQHAVSATQSPQGGPVHLNVPFRDPLAPVSDGGLAQAFGAGEEWSTFFSRLAPTPPDGLDAGDMVAAALTPDVHGAIIVGPNQPAEIEPFVSAVGELARRLGWPVLADGLSPVRNHCAHVSNVVTTYDAILRSPAAALRLAPEVVVCVGGWPTSKVLRGWIEANDPAIWLVTERVDNRDPLHGRTHQARASLTAFANAVAEASGPSGYQRMWAQYEVKARAAFEERLAAATDMVEPKAAWLLARDLPAGTPLFVANSMPIRDLEYVWPPRNGGVRPLCNRGANGIDGTLSTALGVAQNADRPAVLLTGDLALLHDTNGFLLRPLLRGSLTIVLINNRGGGIFEHLSVAQFDPPFEQFFATPQAVEFDRLCAAYGVEHVAVRDWPHFSELVTNLPAAGLRVLELRTDRKGDARLRKRWFAEVAGALA